MEKRGEGILRQSPVVRQLADEAVEKYQTELLTYEQIKKT